MTRTVSPVGRAVLMQREGVRLNAYLDSVGVPTIGVGHTGRASPPSVHMGMTITQAQAEAIFATDLAPFEVAVNAADLKGRLSRNAYDAAVSLAFNIGAPAFSRSTVARKIAEGDMQAAADAFLMWNKPAVLEGRRKAERAQFLTPDPVIHVDTGKPVLASIETAINAAAKAQGTVPAVQSPGALTAAYVPPAVQQHASTPQAQTWLKRIGAWFRPRAA